MWSSETKLSELKRCTITESLWNRYDISRKSLEVPVRRSPVIIIIIINIYIIIIINYYLF